MDDPDYADKYPEHSGNVLQMAKQAVDARHLSAKRGDYIAGMLDARGSAGGLQTGGFFYACPWLEQQVALEMLYCDDLHDLFVGGKYGVRAQLPTRLAPFVGVGGFAGLFHKGTPHDAEWIVLEDDDHRGHFPNEKRIDPGDDGLHPLFAVYPEVGVHFWLTGKHRLTASAAYYLTTEGRSHDYLLIGASFSRLY